MLLLQIFAFVVGLGVVIATLLSAVRAVVLPRSSNDLISRILFVNLRRLFDLVLNRMPDYERRDRLMAYYAPVSLIALLPYWLLLMTLGYSAMYWATGTDSWRDAFILSGSSLLTLGFAHGVNLLQYILIFSEAAFGLLLVAVLIAYLPTMYSAFSHRELAVNLLEVRAGNPPTAVGMLERYHRIRGLEELTTTWMTWESWFAEIAETHTSLAALVFFRSPQPYHSWLTAAGTILDAAALTASSLDRPPDASAALCLRAGYLALRQIARYFGIPYPAEPRFPDQPISISREEFDAACDHLAESGVPIKEDRDKAWQDFAGWRVNYDSTLIALARLTMAPIVPWVSDRSSFPYTDVRPRRSIFH